MLFDWFRLGSNEFYLVSSCVSNRIRLFPFPFLTSSRTSDISDIFFLTCRTTSDVRTPLTTLIGYLDAAHKGIVTGKERDDYIETARRKAYDLKEYTRF